MIHRILSRRVERLEERSTPLIDDWVHTIRFVDAHGNVAGTLELGPGAQRASAEISAEGTLKDVNEVG